MNSEQEKKSAVRKDQTTGAKTKSKDAAVSRESVKDTLKTATTREHTPYAHRVTSTRSADGFKTTVQAIEGEPPKKTHDPAGPVPRNLSAEEIRKNEEAQATRAAADEKRKRRQIVEQPDRPPTASEQKQLEMLRVQAKQITAKTAASGPVTDAYLPF